MTDFFDWLDNITEWLFITWLPISIQRWYYSVVWIKNGEVNEYEVIRFARIVQKYPDYLYRRLRILGAQEILSTMERLRDVALKQIEDEDNK